MASSPPIATVRYTELLDAFEFVSFGAEFEHSAYIDPDSGAIYCVSCEIEMEEVPDGTITTAQAVRPGESWKTKLQGIALPDLAVEFVA